MTDLRATSGHPMSHRTARPATWEATRRPLIGAALGRHLRALGATRIVLRTIVLGSAALVISGIGHVLAHPARQESPEATKLVTSITGGHAALDSVPPGFAESLGYQPVFEGASLVNPYGGCSTPGGVGPHYFARACRTHDLGYDTLRYAESDGSRLGPWARLHLDIRFLTDLLDSCETAGCRATAAAYFTAVSANSIRQGYQAPTEEPAGPWIGLVVAIGGVATLTPALRVGRQQRRGGGTSSPRPFCFSCSVGWPWTIGGGWLWSGSWPPLPTRPPWPEPRGSTRTNR